MLLLRQVFQPRTLSATKQAALVATPSRFILNENRKLAQPKAQNSRGQVKGKAKKENKNISTKDSAAGEKVVTQEELLKQADEPQLSHSEKVKLVLAHQDMIAKKAKENREAAGFVDSEDEVEEQEQAKRAVSIFAQDIDCVETRKEDMLAKYPWAEAQIEAALASPDRLHIKKRRAEQLLNADRFLDAFSRKGKNMSFDEQKQLRKVLVEAADGEETDYESDQESVPAASSASASEAQQPQYDSIQDRQSAKVEQKDRGLFKYLNVIDKRIMLPPMKPIYKDSQHGGLTLFLELDDVILHTFICDENTGYIAKPTFKEPEHEFMLNEVRLPILVYERDHMHDFLKYLVDVKSDIETVVFSRAEGIYVNGLLKIIDPERKVFDHVLAQNACYRLVKKEDDVDHFLKDISRFKNRKLSRSVLADPDTLNFALTPENGMPIMPYLGENFEDNNVKDDYLLTVIDEIEDLRKMADVRPYLEQQYGHRKLLKNAKLI